MTVTEQPKGARFEGKAVVTFLNDGRQVQLAEPFAYIDNADVRWQVPSEAIVDGASIPRPLWSFIGGPFEGKYREASIIHDWFCDLRCRPWRSVHRVFYEAMLTSGVDVALAKLMYAGVFWGGPRWSETVVANTALAIDERYKNPPLDLPYMDDRDHGSMPGVGPATEERETAPFRYNLSDKDFKKLTRYMSRRDLDLTEIEGIVTRQVWGATKIPLQM